jgi:hypothetical protein
LAQCWQKARPEGATAVTRGDDAVAVARLSSDEVPPVFSHLRDPPGIALLPWRGDGRVAAAFRDGQIVDLIPQLREARHEYGSG